MESTVAEKGVSGTTPKSHSVPRGPTTGRTRGSRGTSTRSSAASAPHRPRGRGVSRPGPSSASPTSSTTERSRGVPPRTPAAGRSTSSPSSSAGHSAAHSTTTSKTRPSKGTSSAGHGRGGTPATRPRVKSDTSSPSSPSKPRDVRPRSSSSAATRSTSSRAHVPAKPSSAPSVSPIMHHPRRDLPLRSTSTPGRGKATRHTKEGAVQVVVLGTGAAASPPRRKRLPVPHHPPVASDVEVRRSWEIEIEKARGPHGPHGETAEGSEAPKAPWTATSLATEKLHRLSVHLHTGEMDVLQESHKNVDTLLGKLRELRGNHPTPPNVSHPPVPPPSSSSSTGSDIRSFGDSASADEFMSDGDLLQYTDDVLPVQNPTHDNKRRGNVYGLHAWGIVDGLDHIGELLRREAYAAMTNGVLCRLLADRLDDLREMVSTLFSLVMTCAGKRTLKLVEDMEQCLEDAREVIRDFGYGGALCEAATPDVVKKEMDAAHTKVNDALQCLMAHVAERSSGGEVGVCGVLEGHTHGVYGLANEGTLLFSCSNDNSIKVWDAEGKVVVQTVEGHEEAVNVIAVHDGVLYSGSADASVKLWDVKTPSVTSKGVLSPSEGTVWSIVVHRDKLVCGFETGVIKVYNLHSWRVPQLVQTLTGHVDKVKALAVYKTSILFSGSVEGTLRMWKLFPSTSADWLLGIEEMDCINALAVDNCTKRLFIGSSSPVIQVSDAETLNVVGTLEGHAHVVNCLLIDGLLLFSGSADRTIRIWYLTTLECAVVLMGHAEVVHGLTLWNETLFSCSGGSEYQVLAWDVSELEDVGESTCT